MSSVPSEETAAEYPRHIMLTVAFTQLKEQGLDDIAELIQQINKAHHAQAKRMAELEGALGGLADFCEQAGFDCQRARALLANEPPAQAGNAPAVTDAQHIAMLQEALAFWLPMVQGGDEMAGRIAKDAWLLCGMAHEDVDKPSAEVLGWISVNAAPVQREKSDFQVPGISYPTTYEDLARLSSVALFNRWIGDRSPAAITVQDAFMAGRAIPHAAAPAQVDPMKLVQIRNVALEEAALIADGMDMHIVSAAIRERVLTDVPAQSD